MKKIKVFSTSNKRILITQEKINTWVEEENIDVHQIEMINGIQHNNEIEIFLVVIYNLS